MPTTPDERPLLDIPAVAQRLGIAEVTVRLYIRDGRLPRVPRMGKVRIRPVDLDAFMAGFDFTQPRAE